MAMNSCGAMFWAAVAAARRRGGSSMASSVRHQVQQWMARLCFDFTSCSHAHYQAVVLAFEVLPRSGC